jgi:hypothetical protein
VGEQDVGPCVRGCVCVRGRVNKMIGIFCVSNSHVCVLGVWRWTNNAFFCGFF